MTRPGSRRAAAVLAAALCGGATAYFAVPDSWSSPGRSAVTETLRGGSPSVPPAGTAGSEPPPSRVANPDTAAADRAAQLAPPSRLVVERLGVDVPVAAQGVDEQGQMALPGDPRVAGWYRFGPAPASAAGAVVVAAHVDSKEYGLGPFARLSSAQPGDRVVVEAGGEQWRYQVTQVVQVGKDTGDLAQFFVRDGAPRLHLVTCTGGYDAESGYEANLVVVADRAEGAG